MSRAEIDKISGITSSTGIAFGKLFIMHDSENPVMEDESQRFDTEKEIIKFKNALTSCINLLGALQKEVRENIGEAEEQIIKAQLDILRKSSLVKEVVQRISREKVNAAQAVREIIINLDQQFLNFEDKTVRLRIADIKDVGYRLLKEINRDRTTQIENLEEPVVLVTTEITATQINQIIKEKVLAIVTERGGINNHASILARSLDIPAIVGIENLIEKVSKKKFAIVDGFTGDLVLDPSEDVLRDYVDKKIKKEARSTPATVETDSGIVETADGQKVYIYANINRLSELNKLKEFSVAGVGLLRSEFLLTGKQGPPSVEDFASSFKNILSFMAPTPVNIRLLDISADKKFPFVSQPKENNPALGNRGIRYLLGNPHLLRTQIEGILEASSAGNVRILLPLITTLQEIREVVNIVRKLEMEISKQGRDIKTHIPIGIVIETPASAVMAEKLAFEVDFFAIGTNDLTQYTLAADRDSYSVKDIYNNLNPAVLKLIRTCVKGAKKASIDISVCGEMASDLLAVPLLLGVGINRLSLPVNQIPRMKELIRAMDVKKARNLAKKAARSMDVKEIKSMVIRYLKRMKKKEKNEKL
ncbi:MAG: phosphoenolpyruvate--protein phosphotransferase [Vulcanimicrobiota bacterium]